MTGGVPASTCARPKPLVTDVPALPVLPAKPRHPATPARTLAIVAATLKEAEAAWLMTIGLTGSTTPVPGIYGGRMTFASSSSFRLVGYTVARGVSVSGTVKIAKPGAPLQFQGLLTVSGRGGAAGVLGLNGRSLRGTLGGKLVG